MKKVVKEFKILVFENETLSEKIFSRPERKEFHLMVDGTFKVDPQRLKATQFVTLSVLYRGLVRINYFKIVRIVKFKKDSLTLFLFLGVSHSLGVDGLQDQRCVQSIV